MSMADRIAVMNNGVLQQFGTPQEIYNRPRSRFVENPRSPLARAEGHHAQADARDLQAGRDTAQRRRQITIDRVQRLQGDHRPRVRVDAVQRHYEDSFLRCPTSF